MDKYQKLSLGIAIGVSTLVFIYNIFLSFGLGNRELSLEDISFPFYIFFPGWVAIFLPLIARQRRKAKLNEEKLKNNLK